MPRLLQVAVLCCLTLRVVSTYRVDLPGLGSLDGAFSALSNTVAVFKGIPYARAPVADLRWRPPQAHGPWTGTLNATVFGSSCFVLEEEEPEEAEDCLFLNVAAPVAALSGAGQLPVMVYIHGGAYTSGDTRNALIDSLVVRSNSSFVVASMNYRLNVFGFLGSAILQDRSGTGAFGNYGIEDQRLALTWIRDHVSAFGGNGKDVTIFGESAGGNSVLQHLAQASSFGLYSKAVIESGAYFPSSPPLVAAEAQYQGILNASGCADLDCLLHKSGTELITLIRQLWSPDPLHYTFGPVIDGVSLPAAPQQLIAEGKYNNKVPVIIGSNRDEASLFLIRDKLLPANASEADLDTFIQKSLPQLTASERETAKQLYSASNYSYPSDLGKYSEPWWIGMRMGTDGLTGLGPCTVRRVARMMVQGKSPAVFAYSFDHPSQEAIRDVNEGNTVAGTGPHSPLVPHASELPYVFSLLEGLSKDAGETSLATSVSTYWQQFARQGDPNVQGLPDWPRYNVDADEIIGFDVGSAGIRTHRHFRQAACDFWEAHLGWPRSETPASILV